jgi:hypothetical protein
VIGGQAETYGKNQHSGSRPDGPVFQQPANEPKLRDGGGRRRTCTAGGKVVVEAGGVTHGAVRYSAWLGASFVAIQCFLSFIVFVRLW